MKTKMKEMLIRIAFLLGGLVVAHFGVTLFLIADLGSDPFNVFIQGLFRTVSNVIPSEWITHGNVHVTVSLMIIVILLFVDRSYVRIGTILCMIFGGPIIDFFTGILSSLVPSEMPVMLRIVLNCLGCVILAYGMTVVIRSEAGTGPNDLVAVVIGDKLKKKFSIIRVIVDVLFACVGFLLGGTVGIGTVICAFLVGTVAGFFMPINQRMIEGVLKKLI